MEEFKSLGLSEDILKSIEEQGFDKPTEIQTKSIPFILSGKDVIAGSATGSGKTLAFGCGIIEKVHSGKGLQALVLTPTRELADQVRNELHKFSKSRELHITSVYGGTDIQPQINDLGNADVVVGTPGRILDHMERKTIDFRKVSILVLDEADRMFDMGFRDDVEAIINVIPKQRQTLLFSATINSQVARLSERHMIEPVKISAEAIVDESKLIQIYFDVPDKQKFSFLVHLLKSEESGLVMVFCNTRDNVDFVANNLKANNIESMAIHGGFSQDKRTKTLSHFHSQKVYVMVCTDVAARGLDIKGVSHVYNYDIPKDPKEYIHRIGRTARAGEEGIAINILSSRDYDNFSRVQRDTSGRIERQDLPDPIPRAQIVWKGEPRMPFRGDMSQEREGNPGRHSGPRQGMRRPSPSWQAKRR